jgi:predicted nucleotide-binding protein
VPLGRKPGGKNRNYPSMTLKEAIQASQVIQDKASGMTVSRLTLANLLDVSPASSKLRDLVGASRFYGLTTGGINSDEFGLTPLGNEVTGGDEVARATALKQAVLSVPPYKTFLEAFNGKKVPSPAVMKEHLIRNCGVEADRASECMEFLLSDATTAGFLRETKGGDYVDFSATPAILTSSDGGMDDDEDEGATDEEALTGAEKRAVIRPTERTPSTTGDQQRGAPKKVFIAHGKNRTPLDQLKKALDTFKVGYAVAVDEPNKGRPISRKVATLMQEECSSGIFIFTADERFLREMVGKPGETEEVWRPSENVVFELGAASIMYENRIVIFKEKSVEFPSDYADLGYIEFEKDQLGVELGALFRELVALDILEVRAKG